MALAGYGSRLRKRAKPNVNEDRKRIKNMKKILENNPGTSLNADNKDLIQNIEAAKERQILRKSRFLEYEDDETVVLQQCETLSEALRTSKHVVVYTGAGISTAASIPDFRGANGIWTKLNSGAKIELERSLTSATPTLTHMVLQALYFKGFVKHVVSQNCDGLHLRSGIPQKGLSEIHGNMFMEICPDCNLEVYRIFDVTERTSLHRHDTERTCEKCGEKLKDTIVHFGEWSKFRWPHNWESASENAEKADMILCLGSSLKVLKSYKHLWLMNRPKRKRPKLYIVNLQWTPKDSQATMKIHSRVDYVMQNIAEKLGINIPEYKPNLDPLYSLATPCEYDGETLFITEDWSKKFNEGNNSKRLVNNKDFVSNIQENTKYNIDTGKNHEDLSEKLNCPNSPDKLTELHTKTTNSDHSLTDIKCEHTTNLSKNDSTSGSGELPPGNTSRATHHFSTDIQSKPATDFLKNNFTSGSNELPSGDASQGHRKVKIPAWFGQGIRSKKYAHSRKRKKRK